MYLAEIPSGGDFILKYSENFDYIKVRKGAPRLVASRQKNMKTETNLRIFVKTNKQKTQKDP